MSKQSASLTHDQERRRLLIGAGAALALPRWSSAREDNVYSIGITTSLTGPLSGAPLAYVQGFEIAVQSAIRSGSLGDKVVNIIKLDDQFKPDVAVSNAIKLIEESGVCAMAGAFGIEVVSALRATLNSRKVPNLVAFSRLQRLRVAQRDDCMFFPSASYEAEVQRIIQHLSTIGLRRVAVCYIDNEFGNSLNAAVKATDAQYKIDIAGVAAINPNGSDIEAKLAPVLALSPQTLVIFAQTPLVSKAITQSMAAGLTGMPVYTISFANPSAIAGMVNGLKGQVVVTEVVPNPTSRKSFLAVQFQKDWATEPRTGAASHNAFEGYVAGNILSQAIQRARGPLPQQIHDVLTDPRGFKLSELTYSFSNRARPGNGYIDMVMVRPDGRLVT